MAKKKEKEIKNVKEVVEEKLKKKKVSADKKEEKKETTQKHGTAGGKETHGQAPKEAHKEASKESPKAEQESQAPPIQLTFHTYLIMLGSIGMQFLGKLPNPQTGKIEKNLMRVKEIIDLLEILEEKTKGNLTVEEDKVFKSQLSSLRLNYVYEKDLKKNDEMKK